MKRLKKGTPGKGGESARDSFSAVPVGSGMKNVWTGWLAGEPYWALAHEHKPPAVIGTKPCLVWISDGALACPRCKPQVRPTWIGWVPVYREQDNAPCIVIVHESVMDLLTGLTYGTRVMVGRSVETSSVYVRRAESQAPRFQSDHEQRQGPRDVTPDLLQMWGIPVLDQWLKCGATTSDNAVSLDLAADEPDDTHKPDAQVYQAPAGEGAAQSADYGAIVNRIKERAGALKPSANGRHDKK